MSELKTVSCNLAAIDVGTNAARLLIKHVDKDVDGKTEFTKLLFFRIPLRLGMDVFNDGFISRERKRKFVDTMKVFRRLMKIYDVDDYRACATSAMREAKNGMKIISQIKHKAHVDLEIITGDEESQIIYDNHLSRLDDRGNYLYVDVGGGSTEVSLIVDKQELYSHSFNVGTIRLLKGKVKKDELQDMKMEIVRICSGRSNIRIIGSGGNINKLFRLANKQKDMDALPVPVLKQLHDDLNSLSIDERIERYGLKPDRADVIVPAAEIFLFVAESSGAMSILVPNVGLADGIINELLTQQ